MKLRSCNGCGLVIDIDNIHKYIYCYYDNKDTILWNVDKDFNQTTIKSVLCPICEQIIDFEEEEKNGNDEN